MERDAMFREYLRDEQGSKGSRVEGVGYWYEDGLCKGDWVQDSRRILSYITICDYDTTYLQENPQRLGWGSWRDILHYILGLHSLCQGQCDQSYTSMFMYYFSNTWTGLDRSRASLCSSGVEIELSPYIHPPFKIATSQSNGLRVKNIVELCMPDVSWSTRVFVVELCCQFWSGDFRGRLPGIVFVAISFSLNEILESSPVLTTVEYLLYFPLCFSVDDYEWWVVCHLLFCNWVVQSQSKLYYIEHWVELLQF